MSMCMVKFSNLVKEVIGGWLGEKEVKPDG
jgi:hypothetical protein